MHHQLTTSHLNKGARVLYINNLGVRSPSILRDWARIQRKIRETFASRSGFCIQSSRLAILSPAIVPAPYGFIPKVVNSVILQAKIRTWLNCRKDGSRVFIYTFLPTPTVLETCLGLKPDALIYFCANNMAGTHPEKQKLLPSERELIRTADAVITTSSKLKQYVEGIEPEKKIITVHPGLDEDWAKAACKAVDEPRQKPLDLADIKEPYIGYIGSISSAEDVFDKELLIESARQNKNASFILVGESYGQNKDLTNEENIFLLGKKKHSDIPDYLYFFKAGILPYRVSQYTDNVNPCKVNEYLAFGLPVISTAIHEVKIRFKGHEDLVMVCDSTRDFITGIRHQVNTAKVGSMNPVRHARIKLALETRWERQFEKIESLLTDLDQKSLSAKKGLTNEDFLARLAFLKKRQTIGLGLLVSISLPLLLFRFTPALEKWGDIIAVDGQLKDEKTLLIISGEGEGQYWNRGFIARAADLEDLDLRTANIRRIILTAPRYDNELDLPMLKAFVSERVPETTKIEVLQKNSSSTYDHSIYVSKYLKRTGSRDVAVLSSRYHTRRFRDLLRSHSNGKYKVTGISNQRKVAVEGSDKLRLLRILTYESFAWLRDRFATY